MMDEIIDQVVTGGSIPATLVNDEETKRLGAATTVAQQCGEICFKMEMHQELEWKPQLTAALLQAKHFVNLRIWDHTHLATPRVTPQKTPSRHTR